MARKSPTNWEAIAKEYIECPEHIRPTYDELAKRYRVSLRQLFRVARQEDWKGRAADFVAIVESKAKDKRMLAKADDIASKMVEFDRQCLQINNALLSQVVAHVKLANENKRLINPKDLDSLSRSFERLRALGIGILEVEEKPLTINVESALEYGEQQAQELLQLYSQKSAA